MNHEHLRRIQLPALQNILEQYGSILPEVRRILNLPEVQAFE